MSDIGWEKSRIRTQIREQRKFITEDELALCGKDLLTEFKTVLKSDKSFFGTFTKARKIAVYRAVGGELPCEALAGFIRSSGKAVLYPRVDGERMEFVKITDPVKQLVPGRFGIPEPLPELAAEDDDSIDIVIVPGIAFDGEGNRLGQGRGYYDRWIGNIEQIKRPLLIGVCMKFQLMSEVPTLSSDIPVDMLLCI